MAADKKAFEDKKRVDTKAAIINTALSVGNALATVKPFMPAAIIAAAFAAASGAVQIATIRSQKYKRGGIVDLGTTPDGVSMTQMKGPSHAGGGIRIFREGSSVPIGEVEGDEILAVINKRSSQAIARMSRINQSGGGRRFATGGVMFSPSSYSVPQPASIPNYYSQQTQDYQNEIVSLRTDLNESIRAISGRIDNLKVHVVESDVTDAQSSIKSIVQQSSF